jgi:tetratricopeptide (TPR) repeat protein
MSEHTGNTQPIRPIKEDDTQPLKPVKKIPRWRSILLSTLGVIILLGLGGLGGFQSGLGIRVDEEKKVLSTQLTEQFQFALVDEQFGRYEAAQQRLEFIIQHDPGFPGAADELAKVLVWMAIPTATPTPTLTPTPDLRGAQALFVTAQQLIAAGDWPNALAALDQLRKQEPTYNTSQVDGMYYFALRNYGVNLIVQQGNLETGIYELTLAERFCGGAPCLDRDANGLREGARAYILASSFYGIDWKQSVYYWSQAAGGWPSLWDGTMTAAQRYQVSLMRYGDQLFGQSKFCDAYQQYQAAQTYGVLDQQAAKNANQAYRECYPPTETPTETVEFPPPVFETPTP